MQLPQLHLQLLRLNGLANIAANIAEQDVVYPIFEYRIIAVDDNTTLIQVHSEIGTLLFGASRTDEGTHFDIVTKSPEGAETFAAKLGEPTTKKEFDTSVFTTTQLFYKGMNLTEAQLAEAIVSTCIAEVPKE